MSHYMYTNKKIMVTSDNRVFFLCEVADSSVTDWTRRKHPKHWTVITFDECTKSLLMPKDKYTAQVGKMYRDEIKTMQNYYDSCGENKRATALTNNYSGNTYRGSRKIGEMKSFFSARMAIPAEEFFKDNFVTMTLCVYGKNKDAFSKYEGVSLKITNEHELIKADEFLEKIRDEASSYGDVEILFYTDICITNH